MMPFKTVLCVYPHQQGLPEKKYCPPIGLEYIATVLEDLVEKVIVIDMRFETNIDNFINDDNVDMVCLSVNWDYQRAAALNIVAKIQPKIKVVLGGRHATTCVEEFFEASPNIDCIVRGDGEEIIRDIASGFPLQNITGISFRQGNNKIIHNATRDLRQLDDSIYPNRKLRRAKYKLLYKNIDLGKNVDFISTSRGCPFNCKFCTFSNNPLGQKRNWSARSALSVIEELKTIDAEFILVVDDNFAADIKRVEKICDLIIAEGIKKTFVVALRIEIYKYPQILKKMFRAGFKVLTIGIESAQDKTLRSMQKGFDTRIAEKAFAEIRKINFYIHGYFIVGCIGENELEMLEIATFAKKLKLDTINLSLLRTEKYSPLNDLIANSRGYYVAKDNIVCSKVHPLESLKDIRRRIRRNYYNFSTMLRIINKIYSVYSIDYCNLAKFTFIFLFMRYTSKCKQAVFKLLYRLRIQKNPI